MKHLGLILLALPLGLMVQGCDREIHLQAARWVDFLNLHQNWWIFLLIWGMVGAAILCSRRAQKGGETNFQRGFGFLAFTCFLFLIGVAVWKAATPEYMAQIHGWRGSTHTPASVTLAPVDTSYVSASGDTIRSVDDVPAGLDVRRVITRRAQPENFQVVQSDNEVDGKVPWWENIIALLVVLSGGIIPWRFKRPGLAVALVPLLAIYHFILRDNFVSGSYPAGDIIKLILVALLVFWVYWRMTQAKKDGQWLTTVDPKPRKPFKFRVLWLHDQNAPFLVFHLVVLLYILFPQVMFTWGRTKWAGVWVAAGLTLVFILLPLVFRTTIEGPTWRRILIGLRVAAGIMLLSAVVPSVFTLTVLVLLYWLSTLVRLGPAQKLVYEWNGADVYRPWFYLWRREDGEGTSYRGPLLDIGEYQQCFRKGTHAGLLSSWFPSNMVRAYIFLEEVLEINTFKSQAYNTVRTPWPETDKFDGLHPDDLKDLGELGVEVTSRINASVYKYVITEPYLTMADEDRMDEQNFVIRKIIEPAVARFTGRSTMDQAVVAKLLRNKQARFMMDGRAVTFFEYVDAALNVYGWALKSIEVEDCDLPEVVKKALEALKEQETKVQTAMNRAKEIGEEAKGEGLKILNALAPLQAALGGDVMALEKAMDYYQKLMLYQGANRFFVIPAEIMAVVTKALPALGIVPPPTTPGTPPATPTP